MTAEARAMRDAGPALVRHRRGRRAAAPQAGFTLIEVLLATVLLAAGLALAFTTLRAATGTTQRGEALAARSERMRAVEGFLRKRIAGARPIAFAAELDGAQQQTRFVGEADRMRFVADLPDYLGRGGPYLHEISIGSEGEGARIDVDLTLVQGGALYREDPPRPPDLLVEGLRSARFRYRGLDENNKPGEWKDAWEERERLPLQVEIVLRDGDGRDWPTMVVALPLAGSFASAGVTL